MLNDELKFRRNSLRIASKMIETSQIVFWYQWEGQKNDGLFPVKLFTGRLINRCWFLGRILEIFVWSITKSSICTIFTSAEINFFRFSYFGFDWCKLRTFVRPVAKRLFGALATRTPVIGTGFTIYCVWDFLRYFWFCHEVLYLFGLIRNSLNIIAVLK